MELSNEDITKFVELYKIRFGKTISRQEAEEFGHNLLNLTRLVYKPIKQAEFTLPKAEP